MATVGFDAGYGMKKIDGSMDLLRDMREMWGPWPIAADAQQAQTVCSAGMQGLSDPLATLTEWDGEAHQLAYPDKKGACFARCPTGYVTKRGVNKFNEEGDWWCTPSVETINAVVDQVIAPPPEPDDGRFKLTADEISMLTPDLQAIAAADPGFLSNNMGYLQQVMTTIKTKFYTPADQTTFDKLDNERYLPLKYDMCNKYAATVSDLRNIETLRSFDSALPLMRGEAAYAPLFTGCPTQADLDQWKFDHDPQAQADASLAQEREATALIQAQLDAAIEAARNNNSDPMSAFGQGLLDGANLIGNGLQSLARNSIDGALGALGIDTTTLYLVGAGALLIVLLK